MANDVKFYSTNPAEQQSYAEQAALLNQRQALAQALMQQGMTPMGNTQMLGRVAVRQSPVEGLAKIAQILMGRQEMQDTAKQQAGLQSQAYASALQRNRPSDGTLSSDQIADAREGSLAQGAQQGSVGPTNDNAQLLAQAIMGAKPKVNPNNPTGIPAEILTARQFGMMPEDVFKEQTKLYSPTDATVQARQGGMDPLEANRAAFAKTTTDGTVLKLRQAGFSDAQIKAAIFGEAAKNAETERKASNEFKNFLTGDSGIVPKIPEFANPVGGVAPNGGLPGGVAPMPGALPIAARTAGAVKGAQEANSIGTVTAPDGSQVPTWMGPAANVGGRQLGLQGGGGAVPPVPAAPQGIPGNTGNQATPASVPPVPVQSQPVAPQAVPQQPRLGQSLSDKTTQEAAAKTVAEMPAQLQSVKQARAGLENALNYMNKSGPATSKGVNALAVVQNLGIPLMEKDTNGFMTLKKYLENSAAQAAASGGFTGSDARFEQFKAGQPNAETMTPQALKSATQYVLSQHDAALARGDFVQKYMAQNPNDPNAGQKALQSWANTYTPKVFEFSRLDPQERVQMVKGMDKGKLAQFKQQYDAAHAQGWVQ